MNCRMCGSADLAEFLDLGHHPPSDSFLTAEALKQPEMYYPLNVLVCMGCGLSQLGYIVLKRVLFGPDYPYDSSTSRTWRDHFGRMAEDLTERLSLDKDSLVIDIGSNVGVLLNGFKVQGLRVLGIEPADNMAAKANEQGIETLNVFFSRDVAQDIASSYGRVSLVTGTNVFAHIDDLVDVVEGVRQLLLPQGALVLEVQYFLDLVTQMEYDQVYHEHLSYITVRPLHSFLKANGLEIFDVQRVPTQGGSLRVFIGFPGRHPVSTKVDEFIRLEEEAGLFTLSRLMGFADRVQASRDAMLQLLVTLRAQGKRVVGIGAPAKGNTMLNYCKISTYLLEQLAEKAPAKIGLYSPGMHIPVVHESCLFEDPPDYGLIFAWNLKDEIMANLSEYGRRGGKYIIPIPTVSVV